ncbi:hypothetical protein [Aestuariimicrobium ganziense]|uniref:hypothetical protein n=1 Tax=Aestuariimicrobium ganziense TaxID=2773677 RepID=UPI001941B4C4|nr:hypothetical protein [Aestuariimicrobium ganziense]
MFVSLIIAHELGHYLQGSVVVSPDSPFVLESGVDDTVGMRKNRRVELQAQCLSVAMVHQGSPLEAATLMTYVYGSDEAHWDVTSGRFWSMQGLKGRAGECNAIIADSSLVDYQP